MGEGLLIKQIALLTLHRRVADHSGGSTDQRERLVAACLEVLEYHDAYQMSYMQGVSGRVNPDIGRCRAFHKFFLCAGHNVVYHTPPSELFDKILHIIV